MRIILGSQSPRRKEILQNHGVDFEVIVADTDENCATQSPSEFVKTVALEKLHAVADTLSTTDDTLIICADTAVAIGDEILGKPTDKDDARRMIKLLSGNTHFVVTGVAMQYGDKIATDFEKTFVTFKDMTNIEIEQYICTNEPYDKAGGYAVQGKAGSFITQVDGDYENVVGLPDKLVQKMAKNLTNVDIFKG